jgi:hypothetical protein
MMTRYVYSGAVLWASIVLDINIAGGLNIVRMRRSTPGSKRCFFVVCMLLGSTLHACAPNFFDEYTYVVSDIIF